MLTPTALEGAWRRERAPRLAHYARLPALAPAGLEIGARTIIATLVRDRWGGPDLALKRDEARILALLTVAYWQPVSPSVIDGLRRAAKAFARGDKALAAIHIAHTGLQKIDTDEETAFRLFAAEKLLDDGLCPRALLVGLGLDPWPLDAIKYSPTQPRDEQGRWTDGGGQSARQSNPDDLGDESVFVAEGAAPAGKDLRSADGSTIVDPNTSQPYPVPPGMDIADNVARGRSIAFLGSPVAIAGTQVSPIVIDGIPVDGRAPIMAAWFAAGQEMDYQRPNGVLGARSMQYRNVTNYNLGAVAAAAGYSLQETLNAAGRYNQIAGRSTAGDTEYGIRPDAVASITQGWNDYHDGKWSRQE